MSDPSTRDNDHFQQVGLQQHSGLQSAQRIAASLADSALVPNAYRGQAGLPNHRGD